MNHLLEIQHLIQKQLWTDPVGALRNLSLLQEDLLWLDSERIFPNQSFIVDRFPKALRYPASHNLEIFYDQCKHDEASKKKYEKIENQYLEFISHLWGVSEFHLVSNLFEKSNLLKKSFPEEMKFFEENFMSFHDFENKPLVFKNYNQIEFLIKLSLKEKITTCVVLADLKTIIWINSLALKILIMHKTDKDFINLVSTTNGLYLR